VTDRIHALTVALDRDIREDDIESLVAVIKHLRYVSAVTAHPVDYQTYAARSLADSEWRKKLLDLLSPTPRP
jgi:hypothetical protein